MDYPSPVRMKGLITRVLNFVIDTKHSCLKVEPRGENGQSSDIRVIQIIQET